MSQALRKFKELHGLVDGPDGGLMVPDRTKAGSHKRQAASRPARLRQQPEVTAVREGGTITITLPLPHKSLNPNSRAHHMTVAEHKRKARGLSCGVLFGNPETRMGWENIEIEVHWYHSTQQVRDRDNIVASLKATVDGLEDAGLVLNDSGVRWGQVHPLVDPECPRVVLTITEFTP